jgi:predicted dithiol-disulfide oxidoreductase (DUF899 family)
VPIFFINPISTNHHRKVSKYSICQAKYAFATFFLTIDNDSQIANHHIPQVVSRSEWLTARKDLLDAEKQLTRTADALASRIRDLPMVKVDKSYIFSGPDGSASLSDLFQGRQQLLIYHFMFGPEDAEGCPSCSFFADHIPDLRHLASRNTSFAVVSRAPIEKILAFKKRMGWTFPWYSSLGSDFNYDFHVTQDEAVAPVEYNYKDKETMEKQGMVWAMRGEQPGMSVFLKEGQDVYHTYSAYARGNEKFLGTYLMLDMTHLGRQDGDAPGLGFMHHDRYE